MARLVGMEGLVAGTVLALSPPSVTIGRDGESDIVLMDNTVSRCHARVNLAKDGQAIVLDQDSVNGVFINGERVQQAILAPGDLLQIGDNVFRFEL